MRVAEVFVLYADETTNRPKRHTHAFSWIVLLALFFCAYTPRAMAQMGATPDNVDKLSFEALTATPPPPRPVYHPHYYTRSSVHYGSSRHGSSRSYGHSSHSSRSSSGHSGGHSGGSSSHGHATVSHRRRR